MAKREVVVGSIAYVDAKGRPRRAYDAGTTVDVHEDNLARFDRLNTLEDTPVLEAPTAAEQLAAADVLAAEAAAFVAWLEAETAHYDAEAAAEAAEAAKAKPARATARGKAADDTIVEL